MYRRALWPNPSGPWPSIADAQGIGCLISWEDLLALRRLIWHRISDALGTEHREGWLQ